MQILNSLINPRQMEKGIKLSNSNLIQRSKIYTEKLLETAMNAHGYSVCENYFSLN